MRTLRDTQKTLMDPLAMKPALFDARRAHQTGKLSYTKNRIAVLKTKGTTYRIPLQHQYDLTQATIFGLNERLTVHEFSPVVGPGTRTLRDAFNDEWKRYAAALDRAAAGKPFDYGVYAFYAREGNLVRYCPAFWHRVVAVASNSKLIMDPKHRLTWSEIRSRFARTVVAVVGCSVGQNIAHTIVQDMRPDAIKLADKGLYKMENINRVRLGYHDLVSPGSARKHIADLLLRNKAAVTAAQLYAIDPYIDVYAYEEGITPQNVARFFGGKDGEPNIDMIFEETDDPRVKMMIREEARKRGIPLIMITDAGSAVQLDIMRYDNVKRLPLSHRISDKKLRAATDAVYDNPGDRDVFFKFVDALIGTDWRDGELDRIIRLKSEIPTSTLIPQLGSTAALAGAIGAETAARLVLGHEYPRRILFNKHTFTVRKWS